MSITRLRLVFGLISIIFSTLAYSSSGGHQLGAIHIHVTTSVCGDRQKLIYTARLFIESLLTLGLNRTHPTPLTLHLVTDGGLLATLVESFARARVRHHALESVVSIDVRQEASRLPDIYRPCAVTRLAYPELFPELERVLHLDFDTVVFSPIEELYGYFDRFGPDHVLAGAPDNWLGLGGNHDDDEAGRTCTQAPPYVWPTGVNSGVLLMDLARLRALGFLDQARHVLTGVPRRRPNGTCPTDFGPYDFTYTGDQEVINYFLNVTPSALLPIEDRWNWRFHDSDPRVWGEGREGPDLFHAVRGYHWGIRFFFFDYERPFEAALDARIRGIEGSMAGYRETVDLGGIIGAGGGVGGRAASDLQRLEASTAQLMISQPQPQRSCGALRSS